MIMVVTIFAFA